MVTSGERQKSVNRCRWRRWSPTTACPNDAVKVVSLDRDPERVAGERAYRLPGRMAQAQTRLRLCLAPATQR